MSTKDTRNDPAGVRQRVGFVCTDPDAQIVMPTVAEDVAFSLRRHKLGRTETARIVGEHLARPDAAVDCYRALAT